MTEALLFDYNGVITDDEEQHRASFAELLAEVGISLSRDQYYADYLGCDDRTAFVDVFRRAGKPLAARTLQALVVRKSQIYTRLIGATPVLVPGLADCFEVIVAAEDVPRCKPDPSGYLAARAALARGGPLDPRRCVVIEDSLAGLRAARAAGMHCVMLTTSHPAAALAAADLVWTSFAGHDPAELTALGDA